MYRFVLAVFVFLEPGSSMAQEFETGHQWPYEKAVITGEQQFIDLEYREGLAYVEFNGKAGFINGKKEVAIPLVYDSNYYISTTPEKDGISKKSKDIYVFREGKAVLKKDGAFGMINRQNEIVIPFVFDLISLYFDKYYKVTYSHHSDSLLEGSYLMTHREGFISYTGDTIIPIRYVWPATAFRSEEALLNFKARTDSILELESKALISYVQAVKIAEREGCYFQNNWLDPPKVSISENAAYWLISSVKTGHTKEGRCAYTNGCITETTYSVKIDATSGEILDKNETYSEHPVWE